MTRTPVVSLTSAVLAHTPGLVLNGSKPSREIATGGSEVAEAIRGSLRVFRDAVEYPPNQSYLGCVHPRDLPTRPWTAQPMVGAAADSRSGEIIPEAAFLGFLACADAFGLLTLAERAAEKAIEALAGHWARSHLDLDRITAATGDLERAALSPGALTVHDAAGQLALVVQPGHPSDPALSADVLLENLACKSTGTFAALHLLRDTNVDPTSVSYVISCSEEAAGDRYQRGGGNMAKAIAEAAGLTDASGVDVKDFCAAPIPAIVVASSLVASGVFDRVLVVGGASLPKLGMKFQGHLKHGMPILEDVLAASALLVEADDGRSPIVRLETVGRHRVRDGGANPQIMRSLVTDPLTRVGLKLTDIDDYATELHNPEVTEPQGSGNVPERNYRTIAALAARNGDIDRADIDAFTASRGMPGFSPTQGHIASALCYMPHAVQRLTTGDASRVQLLAKGSLFLGRMTEQSDGMSIVLERNNGPTTRQPEGDT